MARAFKAIDRAADRALWGSGVVATVILLLLAAFITAEVIARYVLSIHIRGLFDLAVYCLIVFTFLSAAYTLRDGQHISVDMLVSRLPERTRVGLDIGIYLVSLAFPIILGWNAGQWAYESLSRGVMTISEVPILKGILISTIPLGSFLLILQIIRKVVHNIRSLPSYAIPSQTFSRRLRASPLIYIAIFAIGITIGLILAIHINAVVGVIILALVLLFSGMPVFLALGLAGSLGLYFTVDPTALVQTPFFAYQAVSSFPLTALPLFILGGLILEEGKIIHKVFSLLQLFSGRFISAPLIATILVGGFFSAVSGSSVATTAIIAAITLPILIGQGYSKSLSSGVVAGATIGTVIPPSIGYILYGVITGESVGQLFMAGLVPGAIIFGSYGVYVIIRSMVSKQSLFEKGQVPSQVSCPQVSWKDRLLALRGASWGLFTPVFVLGGIYMGIFTPTEAAAVMVVYAVIVCVFITRTIKWQDLIRCTLRGAKISSMILLIIVSARILGAVTSQLQIATDLVTFAETAGLSAIAVLGLLFLVLFILGMLLDAASVMVITLPVFYPLAMAAGFDSVWFGVFYIVTLEIGLLTPPVGLNLFVIRGVSGIPLGTIIRGTAPFLFIMMLSLVVFTLFPQLVTWLPSTMW